MPKWWSANLKDRSRFALSHPGYTCRAVMRDLLAMDERFLARITGSSVSAVRGYLNEPFRHAEFMDLLRNGREILKGLSITSADCYGKRVVMQYAIVRTLKPELVVETGVANGISSAYLLLALERNGRGMLHSIEVGDGTYLPAGRPNGWIVPGWLRKRWSLHWGDSRRLVPDLLNELGTIDIFIHDSLHTYEHMKFEYEQAYPHLRRGGVLISDDALWNRAFGDFAGQAHPAASQILRGIGIMKKAGDPPRRKITAAVRGREPAGRDSR